MPVIARAFLCSKVGHRLLECEDSVGVLATKGRFAVADGATESFDSRRWARALTKLWVQARSIRFDPIEMLLTVHELGEWLARKWSTRAMPWYVAERATEPAFAAFLGLQLVPDAENRGYRWRAVALGDCCLVVVRRGHPFESFPLSTPEDFTIRPVLVSSKPSADPGPMLKAVVVREGCVEPGDTIWLLSDAVAKWMLEYGLRERPVLAVLEAACAQASDDALGQLVESERSAHRLRNDDVAIVRIEIH